MISAILLAAGESKRMEDENKLIKEIDGTPLIKYAVKNILGSAVDELIVVLGHEKIIIENIIEKNKKIKFVYNESYQKGISTSIIKGLNSVSKKTKAFFICMGDMPDVNQSIYMVANNKKSIKNFSGVFTLLEFFVFLKHCNLLITNDSGVMNMALTTTIPQLLLAGPVNPNQYFIKNDYRSYIYHQTYCSPCTHNVDSPPCGGDNKCMQEISVKEVITSAERLLSGKMTIPIHQVTFSSNYETLYSFIVFFQLKL